MIPKKIHYCWFGEKEPGELEQKCIESWKKILPDYELRFWGNDCLDRFDNKYLRQAVEAKSGLCFPIMCACMLCWKKAVFTLTRMKKSSAGWTSLWNTTFLSVPNGAERPRRFHLH